MLASFFKPKAAAPSKAAPTPVATKTKKATDGDVMSPSVFSPPTAPARGRTDDAAPAAAPAKPAAAVEASKPADAALKPAGPIAKKKKGPGAAIAAGRVGKGFTAGVVSKAASPGGAAASPKKQAKIPSKVAAGPAPKVARVPPLVGILQKNLKELEQQKAAAIEAEDYDLAESLKPKVAVAKKALESTVSPRPAAVSPKQTVSGASAEEAEASGLGAEVIKTTDIGLKIVLTEVVNCSFSFSFVQTCSGPFRRHVSPAHKAASVFVLLPHRRASWS